MVALAAKVVIFLAAFAGMEVFAWAIFTVARDHF
jgi:hypothetical protein